MDMNRRNLKTGLHLITIMTLLIFVMIYGIATVSRNSIKAIEVSNISSDSKDKVINKNENLNEAETEILTLLTQMPRIYNNSEGKVYNLTLNYIHYLTVYLSANNVELSADKIDEMLAIVQGCKEVITLEKENDMSKMSLDGTKLILYIYQEIYHTCGLGITFGSDNNIEKIVSEAGELIYQNNYAGQTSLNTEAAIITFSSLLMLFTVCFLIAKKNQLFIKGGKYHGFDEKEYA